MKYILVKINLNSNKRKIYRTGVSHVINIPDNLGDKVGIELKSLVPAATEIKSNFVIDLMWNSITKSDIISVGAGLRGFQFNTHFITKIVRDFDHVTQTSPGHVTITKIAKA